MSSKQLTYQDYTVGWICALPLEETASITMLDEEHSPLPKQPHDDNTYTLGRIGNHNVAMACLPAGETGTNGAATLAAEMLHTFDRIKIGLLVGIGGGIPYNKNDLRLGDVVVSSPGIENCVVQWDFGKAEVNKFRHTGTLSKPPTALLSALSAIRAKEPLGLGNLTPYLSQSKEKIVPEEQADFAYQGAEYDELFEANYDHDEQFDTCEKCDRNKLVAREARANTNPKIHYGTIASGNQVIKDGRIRDDLAHRFGALCVEMEAAGLMNHFPCLVIRGICDYADSHKNKRWQGYAASTAAAYAKTILTHGIQADTIASEPTAKEVIEHHGFGPCPPASSEGGPDVEGGGYDKARTKAEPKRTDMPADTRYAFLSKFDTIFLIDDSDSMAGQSWREVSTALATIVPICTEHDLAGIDIYFLHNRNPATANSSGGAYTNITTPERVKQIFNSVHPQGDTPTAARLNDILTPYLKQLGAHNLRGSTELNVARNPIIRPLNIIVITDGLPSDDVESVILSAARKLDRLEAVPWQVGIQFFQVGSNPDATEDLRYLDDTLEEKGVRDIVDTVSWEGRPGPLTAATVLKVVLGAVHRKYDHQRVRLD